MTKKDFELIAETIKSLDPLSAKIAAYAFARVLVQTNTNFNPDRFLKACGISNY